MHIKQIALFIVLMLGSSAAIACLVDANCDAGSKCVKQQSQLFGECLAPIRPNEQYDNIPVRFKPYIDSAVRNRCNFSFQCGADYWCSKDFGNMQGECVKAQRH